MLINSDDIKTTKEHIEVMQAFIDGKEIEYRFSTPTDSILWRIAQTPIWDFDNYAYRIKPLESEYIYPIHKRLKQCQETIVKFTAIDAGIYMSTRSKSIYRLGDAALNMIPHTDSSWEDCAVRIDKEKIIIEQSNTKELFEVMVYCHIVEEFKIIKQLHSNEDLEESKHYQKTGRSFIIDKDTNQIIKVNCN